MRGASSGDDRATLVHVALPFPSSAWYLAVVCPSSASGIPCVPILSTHRAIHTHWTYLAVPLLLLWLLLSLGANPSNRAHA